MLHIQCLLAMMFREHFKELINRGYVYIACPPKYRITVNGKYLYFKNDKEYNDYKTKYLKKKYDVQSNTITMMDIVKNSEYFMYHFKMLMNKYSLPEDVLSMLLSNDTILPVAEYLDEQGLEVAEIGDDEFYVQGLLDNNWIDIELTKELVKEVKVLSNYFNCTTFDIIDKADGTVYECDIADAIQLLEKEFKFTRYRYKGLGETNPDELGETTMNPNTRDIIKVVGDMSDSESELNKVLFGSNADLRKDFIQENL